MRIRRAMCNTSCVYPRASVFHHAGNRGNLTPRRHERDEGGHRSNDDGHFSNDYAANALRKLCLTTLHVIGTAAFMHFARISIGRIYYKDTLGTRGTNAYLLLVISFYRLFVTIVSR